MPNKGEKTRKKILSEASRIFLQKGFRGTSLSDLLAATGMKKGGLYFHFSNKDEIGLAVLEQERAAHDAFMEKTLQGSTPGACLNNFFSAIIDWQRQVQFVGGCIFGNTALEMSDADEQFARFVEQVFSDYIERIAAIVSAAKDSGEIQSELPAHILARHIVATIEGAIMLARLQKNERPLTECFHSMRSLLGMIR